LKVARLAGIPEAAIDIAQKVLDAGNSMDVDVLVCQLFFGSHISE